MRKGPLLALLTMMGCLSSMSIDIFLPVMPGLGETFNASPARVQLSLIAFVLGFALGQLGFGPISDAYGRRRPLILGTALYLAGALICLFASSLNLLIAARFLQGLGACCGAVSFVAIIRDMFEGVELARVLAQVGVFCGMAPVLAPAGGALLAGSLGWRAVFIFLSLFSLILLVWVARSLPETSKPGGGLHGPSILRFYGTLLQNRDFLNYSLINGLTFCGVFLFLSTSSSLFMETHGVSQSMYGLLVSLNAVCYMAGCQTAARCVPGMGVPATVRMGSLLSLTGGCIMLVFAKHLSIANVMGPMFLAAFGVGVTMPAATGGAMEPFARQGGRASALHGFLRFAMASVAGLALGGYATNSASVLSLTLILGNLVCLFLSPQPGTAVESCAEAG